MQELRREPARDPAELARLTPHIEVVPADLHHGLGFLEPEFPREQVTATEQYTA